MAGLHFLKQHPTQLLLVATISACSFPLFAASETPETLVVTGKKQSACLPIALCVLKWLLSKT